jgi:Ca-activated chloride channel family protein
MIPDFNFGFINGAYFLLVIPLIILAAFVLFNYRQRTLETFVSSPTLRQQIILPRSRLHFLLQTLCLALAWGFAVIALMAPQGNGRYTESALGVPTLIQTTSISPPSEEIIFFIDTSASMSVKDTHSAIPRIDYAKEIIEASMNELEGAIVSLYAFTSDITPLVPPTFDYFFTQLILKHVTINEGDVAGTDLLKLTDYIKENLIEQRETPTNRSIFILSDGGDTLMESLSGKEKGLREEAIVRNVQHASENHVSIYTIGIGSLQKQEIPFMFDHGKPVTTAVEETLLKRIAETGGGSYYLADNYTASLLQNVVKTKLHAEKIEKQSNRRHKQNVTQTQSSRPQFNVVYDSYYQVPLALAILLLAASLLIPNTRTHPNRLHTPAEGINQ